MTCTACKTGNTKVIDSRRTASGSQYRRRRCLECKARFSTVEVALGPRTRRETVDLRRALSAVQRVIEISESLTYP